MGVAEAQQPGPRLPGRPDGQGYAGFHMVGVAMGHENFDPLQGEHPLLRQIGPAAVAVARHIGDGQVGKPAGQLLRVPGQIPHVEHPVGPLQAHRVRHVCHVAVGVGKKKQLHAITFPGNAHRMERTLLSIMEMELMV